MSDMMKSTDLDLDATALTVSDTFRETFSAEDVETGSSVVVHSASDNVNATMNDTNTNNDNDDDFVDNAPSSSGNGNSHHLNNSNHSRRSSSSSRPRWILVGTVGILAIVGLVVALSAGRSGGPTVTVEQATAATVVVADAEEEDGNAPWMNSNVGDVAVDEKIIIETTAAADDDNGEGSELLAVSAGAAGNEDKDKDENASLTTFTVDNGNDLTLTAAANVNGSNSDSDSNDSGTISSFKPELSIDIFGSGSGDSSSSASAALLNPNLEEVITATTTTATETTAVTTTTTTLATSPIISSSPTKLPSESTTTTVVANGNDGDDATVVVMFSRNPTSMPTNVPTLNPTKLPNNQPTEPFSTSPSNKPSSEPTKQLITPKPTSEPTKLPLNQQPALYQAFFESNFQYMDPTLVPTPKPTSIPTSFPTKPPTLHPTNIPTPIPTREPSPAPTGEPTNQPLSFIDQQPALYQAFLEGNFQTQNPSPRPTPDPTSLPTPMPTTFPTKKPTDEPTVPANPYFFGEDEFYTYTEDGVSLQVSRGLSVRLLVKTGSKVQYANGDKSKDEWHTRSDAAGIIPECPDTPTECGYAYASNSEEGDGNGGVYGLYFDKDGNILNYKALLTGTTDNCGGGISPWNTWISCEEFSDGQCWQVDPYGSEKAKETELGGNGGRYESVAVDNRNPDMPVFFTTEDDGEGALRRFQAVGRGWDALHTKGTTTYLNILSDTTFEWTDDEDAGRASASKYFPNSEGIQVHEGRVYFMAKKLKRLLVLDLETNTYTKETTGGKFYGEGDFGDQPDQNLFGATRKYMYFTEDGGKKPGVYARFGGDGMYFTMFEADLEEEDETVGIALSPDHTRFIAGIQDHGYIYEFRRNDGLPFE